MDLDAAKCILKRADIELGDDASLFLLRGRERYVEWFPRADDITLDGRFSADVLEALVVWLRAYGG